MRQTNLKLQLGGSKIMADKAERECLHSSSLEDVLPSTGRL